MKSRSQFFTSKGRITFSLFKFIEHIALEENVYSFKVFERKQLNSVHTTVTNKDKLSINSADVQKDRNTTSQ